MKRKIVGRFPGTGCAYMDSAGKVTEEYYGFADKENNIPVDGGTIFPACSISKFITSICLMILRERNVIDIDAPVNNYLRQWKYLSANGSESGAAVRSFMCHTSGTVDGEGSFHGLRRGGPEVSLMDILEGRNAYNNRPVREENPERTVFEYSDAGYCVLQQLIQEVTGRAFEDAVRETVFDKLNLSSTFFASPANVAYYETNRTMATGYDSRGIPIPGRFPPVPDLAASGMWCAPVELLAIAKEFAAALGGRSALLKEESAREMVRPAENFPWVGLGIFIDGNDMLVSQGWGENGQCMLKMNRRTEEISVVMTNCDPDADQKESGVEWLADSMLTVC